MPDQPLGDPGIQRTTTGTSTEVLTSYHGFEQVINKPTYILLNSISFIVLIFANNQTQ